MKKWEKLLGVRFSSLTLTGVEKRGTKYPGVFKCDCGEQTIVDIYKVKNGLVKSCGCQRNKNIAKTKKKYDSIPGGVNSPEYQSWRAMKERCLNPNSKSYPRYGGRGIKIDERWIKSFRKFYYDMGKKPDPSYTLDRINNEGNYRMENCRWVSRSVQNRNQSRWLENKSHLKGIMRANNSNRWVAHITINYKHHYIGTFLTPEAASRAYQEVKNKVKNEKAQSKTLGVLT